jgi:hypothetical protein
MEPASAFALELRHGKVKVEAKLKLVDAPVPRPGFGCLRGKSG